ncbi:CYTH and CHAD domain-containing protein [Cryobacterium sp. TMT1-21]|uniref:CYTH and CHAD domain-containing protein n=1 Tax=Cryobacterium shii TaxID=1259235 RepID=A0AAQ2HEE2_9MICO|nr:MULTISPECIES: CYTH and CHAD domain-containing protein [Cryobacterium]TFC42582.1 CYTH and CHAD domain-containing protein [Cryobacterium shii]TFC80914.1 CYTH and CHAD domain-containing protein [Cryobacterium sp. TmT2-59]TFD15558.1 CYTH and CHAD domain-containing protein [Cryobacterium sp. TMT1-21]TFD18580.1 CYTH and CHAD domain-containing protein [Cryobacterium sp. TMT4-10]TFD28382.1 CYTH and CHAD domain-containing protein [Cryobacterium sp. TMT2-23]
MTSDGFAEIERKFDVNAATVLPALHDLPGVTHVEPPVEHDLDALYYDTDDLALANRRMTLRRRTGGDDAGWHLKLPVSVDERREMREPLGSDPAQIPEPILNLVRVFLRGRVLVPVVRLHTRRVVHLLVGKNERVLAEVCDDEVEAERFGTGAGGADAFQQSWREWEVELVNGSRALLDAAQERLSSVGVEPATSPSKLARALGDRAPVLGAPVSFRPTRKSSTRTVLLAYLHEQVEAISAQDARVRENDVEAVHRMRVATRRLRSALATYRDFLDTDVTAPLRVELRWIAGVLGGARDAQVIQQRLAHRLAEEPENLVAGPVVQRVDGHFGTVIRAARGDALAALNSDRYFRLLDSLDALLASPPLLPDAAKRADRVIPTLIRADWKRLRASVRTARLTPAGTARDAALHEARKRAKRLRYAAETAAPLRRRRATRLVAAARQVQDTLGDHQDSVVARGVLLNLGMAAFLHSENAFTYGRLHAVEQTGAAATEARFFRSWADFPSASLKK